MKRNKILKKLGYSNFQEYLDSNHWLFVKTKFKNSNRPKECFVCNSQNTQIHHKNYKNLGNESLDDLVASCRCCQEKIQELIIERPSLSLSLAYVILKRKKLKEIPKKGEIQVHCQQCRKNYCVYKRRFNAELEIMNKMGRPWSCKSCRKHVLLIPDVLVQKKGGFYSCILKTTTLNKFSLTKQSVFVDSNIHDQQL
jgi:hypothetical protein